MQIQKEKSKKTKKIASASANYFVIMKLFHIGITPNELPHS
jgi:hypothetical protein